MLPYSITLLTQLLFTFPLVVKCKGHEVSIGSSSRNLPYADFTLVAELSSQPVFFAYTSLWEKRNKYHIHYLFTLSSYCCNIYVLFANGSVFFVCPFFFCSLELVLVNFIILYLFKSYVFIYILPLVLLLYTQCVLFSFILYLLNIIFIFFIISAIT